MNQNKKLTEKIIYFCLFTCMSRDHNQHQRTMNMQMCYVIIKIGYKITGLLQIKIHYVKEDQVTKKLVNLCILMCLKDKALIYLNNSNKY